MTTSIERLEELLNIKDQQLEEKQNEIENLERRLEFGVDWMLHQYVKSNDDMLPVPRIELHITEDQRCYQESQVTLVLPQRDGTLVRVPLSYGKRSGSLSGFEHFPVEGELSDRCIMDLPSLVNDACFFMENTDIPAYVVLDETRKYKITSLRPLKMSAVQ